MRKHIALFLSVLLLSAMTGCGQSDNPMPSASTAASMPQMTGCGQSDGLMPLEELPEDYSLEQAKKDGCITHEALKAGYPRLYIHGLSFDGEQYTIRWYEDGQEIVRNYSCLMKYEGPADGPYVAYKSYTRYVLTNDDKVTWQELVRGMTSSQLGDYIEHMNVCRKREGDSPETGKDPKL